jgi:hypothetical protein
MNNIVAIHKFVVDGDGAEKIHEIFQKSYFIETNCVMQPYEGCTTQVDFSYADGVFHVEEKTTGQMSYIAEILYFFADRDHIYAMSEYLEDGEVQSYSVEDEEGKYFVRPPKTQWELQMEEMQNQRSKDLPF